MQLFNIVSFGENKKEYELLMDNSWYIKDLNRGVKSFNTFVEEMKIKYKQRTTDKINNVIDNMDLINSFLDVLK